MRSRNEVRSVGNSNAGPPELVMRMFPQMSGFGLNASTPRKATKADRQDHRSLSGDARLRATERIWALQLPPITFGSREIARSSSRSPASIGRSRRCSGGPAMTPDCKTKKGRTMLRKLLGAAAMAATAFAFVPAHAAHVHHAVRVGVGCSGDNFAKAEGGVETMADSPAKFMAEREIAQAQDAMLSGQDEWMRHASWPGVAR